MESDKPLPDALHIIVRSAAGEASVEASLLHDLLRACEVKDKLHLSNIGHDLCPDLVVVVVAGEPVNKELGVVGGEDCLAEKADGDLGGDDAALLDHPGDELPVLTAALHLGPEKISGGKMGEAKGLDDLGALGTLAAAGAAENEHYLRLGHDNNILCVCLETMEMKKKGKRKRNGIDWNYKVLRGNKKVKKILSVFWGEEIFGE